MIDSLSCPFPLQTYPSITLAHGGGGRFTQRLIDELFRPAFNSEVLDRAADAGVVTLATERIAVSVDSFVVQPLFFAGGDIGKLAVCGTVNDLAMMGARPRYLTAGFIIEEGLSTQTLWEVVRSMATTAKACDLQLIAGDTKVVERGHGDGVFITATGIGALHPTAQISPDGIKDGDLLLVSGDLGRHGMAIMQERAGLGFEGKLVSDCAPLMDPILALLDAGIEIHAARDLTRGGLVAALCELSESSGVTIRLEESTLPVQHQVRMACELLGLDALHVACEGRFACFIADAQLDAALKVLSQFEVTAGACAIGKAHTAVTPKVLLHTTFGATRRLERLSGEQLPRIC